MSSLRLRTSVAVLSLLAGILASAEAAEIKLKRRVASPGSLILLGDVATISGSQATEVDALKRVELFPAPSRGDSRILRRREIRELLSLHGVDVRRHKIAGADRVHVAARLQQPERRPNLAPAPRPAPAPTQWYVVAKRKLTRGQVVGSADVSLQQQPENTRLSENVVRDIQDVVDMEVTRRLEPGQVIDANMIRRQIFVERNQLITVVARSPGVRVQVTAKAVEPGSLGDVIFVLNPDTREKYRARVTGPRQAEVFASGTTVSNAVTGSESRSSRLSSNKRP